MSPVIAAIAFILLGYILRRHSYRIDARQKRPPSLAPLPKIDSLHLLRHLQHRALQNMAKTYGPIMSLRPGSVETIVISTGGAAVAFLKTHNAVFASRAKTQAYEQLSYGGKGVFTKYNAYRRNIRKLCTMQLLSASKTESFGYIQKEELGFLVKSPKDDTGEVVNVSKKVLEMIVRDHHQPKYTSPK
ncbi:Angelicin synthase [Morus notabilis]|uniref:Angelicin synthase n=1 Tax=Morus notabilis TaxID=981085 RepID=W9SE13_9ROSA|nr:cytochrome P450 CYP736A12 [Morus notabilis]EXC28003.1 Angelicin synthase [Morus notabilis]